MCKWRAQHCLYEGEKSFFCVLTFVQKSTFSSVFFNLVVSSLSTKCSTADITSLTTRLSSWEKVSSVSLLDSRIHNLNLIPLSSRSYTHRSVSLCNTSSHVSRELSSYAFCIAKQRPSWFTMPIASHWLSIEIIMSKTCDAVERSACIFVKRG